MTPLREKIAAREALLGAEPARQIRKSGAVVACELAKVMDEVLREHAAEVYARHPIPAAIVVLGGQGRSERCPGSDVDVLVLHDGNVSKLADDFLYPLWDARLELGHGVRTVKETIALAEKDPAALTSLLDARLLFGDEALFAQLQKAMHRLFAKAGEAYVERVLAPMQSRSAAESEAFVLEPELKLGSGGLRDLQQIRWVANFRYGVRDFAAMPERGVLSVSELRQLQAARNFLLEARIALHRLAGRKQDRLSFEYHHGLAAVLCADHEAPVDALLQRHYRHARAVIDIKHRVLMRIDSELHPSRAKAKEIAPGFTRRDSKLEAARLAPHEILRLFALSLEYNLPIDERTLDTVREHAADIEQVRDEPQNAALFWSIIDHPHGDTALLDMHEAGVLGRLLPEFGRATHRVQADFYHVYTVDVHTLRLLRLVYELRRGGGDLHFAPLVQSEESFRSLIMGCLFHDAGKGSGRDHSEYGAELVAQAMVRLRAPLGDIHDAQFLVLQHLTMPKLSQRRDLSDDALIRDFAERCGGPERLRRLYVLSYADTHATGPALWTPWKAALLRELYERTRAAFAERVDISTDDNAAQDRPPPSGNECYLGGEEHGHRLLYVAFKDRPGLVATVAAVCTECRISISSAEVRSRAGFAFDRFMIRDTQPTEPGNEAASRHAHYDLFLIRLRAVLADGINLDAIAVPPFRAPYRLPAVRVQLGETSALGQVVEVFAPDRPGLLFSLARTIFHAGYSIEVARISTEGARAIDVFYLRPTPQALDLPTLLASLADAAHSPRT